VAAVQLAGGRAAGQPTSTDPASLDRPARRAARRVVARSAL